MMLKFRANSSKGPTERKRSVRACSGCRSRKVRCDVTTRGTPCTSCRFYDIPCSIPIDRRGKGSRAARKATFEEPLCEDELVDVEKLDTVQVTNTLDRTPQYWTEAEQDSPEAPQSPMSDNKSLVNWSKWLPDYAGPLAPSITSDDCNALSNQGAFEVPDIESRAKVLNSYVQFVHPSLPILNLEDFLMVVDKSYNGSRGISFLLFQAVVFAATAFQSNNSLALEGFKNRQEARKIRFQRVRLLYSYNCEENRITILQSVLLMTYWDDESNNTEDAWHFVGVAKAILDAIKAGPTDSERKFIRQQPGLWKRLIWSCYMRDRLVCLSTRRPFQFDEAEFDIQTLQPSDFEVGPLSTKCCLGSDGSHPAMRDPSMQSVLSQVSISLLQCCQLITRIVNCHYTTPRQTSKATNSFKSHLVPKRPCAIGAEVLLRDAELEDWTNSLPDALRWCPFNPPKQTDKHGEVFIYFRTMLSGIYSLACSTLHRPQLATIGSRLPELIELSKERIYQSADTITQTYKYFKSQDLTHLFHDTQVAIFETALVTHLGNLESTESSIRQSAMKGFQSCAQGLQKLKETYPSASLALLFIDAAVQKQNIALETRDKSLNPRMHNNMTISEDPTMIQGAEKDPANKLSPSSIAVLLDELKPPQMSKLLCSHFMMTSSERSLLQSLSSTEASSPGPWSDDDCFSDKDSSDPSACGSDRYGSHFSATQVVPEMDNTLEFSDLYPPAEVYGHENDDYWSFLPSLPYPTDIESNIYYDI